jgi:hypothetical protein
MAGATVMVRRSARLLAAATLGSRSPGLGPGTVRPSQRMRFPRTEMVWRRKLNLKTLVVVVL